MRCPGPQPVIPQTPVNKLNQSLNGLFILHQTTLIFKSGILFCFLKIKDGNQSIHCIENDTFIA